MIRKNAELLFRHEKWDEIYCECCAKSLERGGGIRPEVDKPVETHAIVVCHDCHYSLDLAEFRQTKLCEVLSQVT